MSCCSMTGASTPAPQAAAKSPISQRNLAAAQQSLDAIDTMVGTEGAATPRLELTQPSDHLAAQVRIPQYTRTFVQGCACSTGFAGGGCCPSGASNLALQTGCGAHGLLGVLGGALGALGLYGGIRVLNNSRDALRQIQRVQGALSAQMDGLALGEAEARALQVPHGRISAELRHLGAFARALNTSASEQRFNFWVPGVVQTLAAAGGIYVAAAHAGLRLLGPSVGTLVGVAAPTLFAVYGLFLAGKQWHERRRIPASVFVPNPSESSAAQAYAAQAHSYAQARRNTVTRTAWAWGLVGAAGVVGSVVSAGLYAPPLAPMALVALSLGAAAFAMWQNSQTRFVPHLPVSSHVAPQALGTPTDRQRTVQALSAQDVAIKEAARALMADASVATQGAHVFECAFRPQCGPSANQVLAGVVRRTAQGADRMPAARQTRTMLRAASVWCAEEYALVQARMAQSRAELGADVEAFAAQLAPSCKHKAKRMAEALAAEGALAQTLRLASSYVRDDAQRLEAEGLRLSALSHVQQSLRTLEHSDMQDVVGHDVDVHVEGPAKLWLWTRLNLLALSNTLADALDKTLIVQNPTLFSQLTTPEALPIHNVYVLPSQLDAFAQVMAPRLDGAFAHAFFNTRRIEAEIDYVFEREAAAQLHPSTGTVAPVCTGESCCR